jgi:hypothetical protein
MLQFLKFLLHSVTACSLTSKTNILVVNGYDNISSGFISTHQEEGESLSLNLNYKTLRLSDNAHNHWIVKPMRMLASSK